MKHLKPLGFVAVIAIICGLQVLSTQAVTGDTLDTFKVISTSTITPRNASNTLQLPILGGHGTKCVHVNNSGTLATAAADCGSGGGGSASGTIQDGVIGQVGVYTATDTIGPDGGNDSFLNGNLFVNNAFGLYVTDPTQPLTFISSNASNTAGFRNVVSSGDLTFDYNAITSGGRTITWRDLSGTVAFLSDLITKAILSINGASSTAQTIVGGTGITVATTAGATNSTTTVTNTGVTSLSNNSASGGIDFSAATGSTITAILHSLALSQFTGNIVNTFNGATGTITYAPSTTIPTSFVSSFNGATGTVTGVGSLIGTANQITVSNPTGTVTLSIPSPLVVSTINANTFNATTSIVDAGTLAVTGQSTLASASSTNFQTSGNATVGTYLNVATTTNSEPLTLQGNQRINAGQIYETVFDNGTTTATSTNFNWNNGNKQIWALGAATTTITFSNVKNGASYTAWLMQDGTGSRTVTWTTTGTGRINWASSTIPTLSTGANAMDVFSFQCFTPHTTTTLSCYGQYGSGNFTQ